MFRVDHNIKLLIQKLLIISSFLFTFSEFMVIVDKWLQLCLSKCFLVNDKEKCDFTTSVLCAWYFRGNASGEQSVQLTDWNSSTRSRQH